MALRPKSGHGRLILEVSISHTTTHHSRWDSSGRVISSSLRPIPDNNTQHSKQTSMPAAGFEPTISAGERPHTYVLDSAATGIGCLRHPVSKYQAGKALRTNGQETVILNSDEKTF